MRIKDRTPWAWASAPFEGRHYRVLLNLRRVSPGFEFLWRYLTQSGTYPWKPSFRLADGVFEPVLESRHDLLTANEVFLRLDYGGLGGLRVVDIGANVGLAARFFLAARPDTRVVCYEPVPRNVERLRQNLAGYEDRSLIVQAAVGTAGGVQRFAVEDTGRYGRLGVEGSIDVDVHEPSRVAAESTEFLGGPPDVVKIDTEGSEQELVASFRDLMRGGGWLVYEGRRGSRRERIVPRDR